MSSLTPAAQQLVQQVQAISGHAKVSPTGGVDGFGRIRSVEFDPRTSKWLVPALDAVNDERIRSVTYQGKGRAVVAFVGDTRADRRDPFPIEDALRVLEGRD